jgi:hypothetical protein
MDLWLPGEAEILVKVGDNVKGGASVLARMPEAQAVRVLHSRPPSGKASQKLQEEPGS